MAINGGDVKFSFTGDSSDLNAALAKAGKNLDGLTVAGQGAANKIGKDLNKASIKSSKSLHNFTESAGDADSVMMGLAGAIDLVNPALGDMVRTSGDALAGTEAMGRAIKFSNPIFIALSVAAAALGAAYFFLKEDTVEAEAATLALKEQQEALNKVISGSDDKIITYGRQLAVLNGTMTESDAAFQTMEEAIRDRFSVALDGATGRMEKAQVELRQMAYDGTALATAENTASEQRNKNLKEATNNNKKYEATRAALTATIALERAEGEKLTAKYMEEVEEGHKVLLFKVEQKAATEAAAAADKKAAIATRARTQAERDAEAQARKDAAATTAAKKKSDAEKLKSAQEYAKAHADAAASVALDVAAEIANTQRAADEAKQAYLDRIGYQGDFVSASGDLAVALTERLGASAKTQAMVAYAASKASAVSQILISSMVAAAKVTEQTGIGAILAVPAVAALTAVQLAAVLATPPPKFHSGGMIAPDERMITAQTGEAVLSRSGVAAAGGASGVNNLNRGGGGGAIVVVNQYRHRVFDSFIMDNLRRTGSPLAAAIGATGNKAGILR